MSVRSTVLAASAFVLALVFVAGTPAKPPTSPGDKQSPTTPTNLRITASSPTSISLAWNAGTDNSSTWWYCVQKDGDGCFRVDPPRTMFTMTNLMPDRTTTWTVYAIDARGNRSGNSNAVTYTTPPDTTPPSPAPTLSAAIVVPTWIHVTWTRSVDSQTQVFYKLVLDGRVISESVGWQFYTALHLEPSSTHEFQVIARDSYGNSVASNVLTVTTPPKRDDVAPTASHEPGARVPELPGRGVALVDSVDRRHRSAVTDPLRGVLQRRSARRRRRHRRGQHDRVLPQRDRPGRDRRAGSRHVRQRLRAEQRDPLRLLTNNR